MSSGLWRRRTHPESILQTPLVPRPLHSPTLTRGEHWPVLESGGGAEDPELAENAAECQVGVLFVLDGHHPGELGAAHEVLL